jgi:hypothetical protein
MNLYGGYVFDLGSDLKVMYGLPLEIIPRLVEEHEITSVFSNRDYEPYALERDAQLFEKLKALSCEFIGAKDHVIFEKNEVLKDDGLPYTIFTPYSRKWKAKLSDFYLSSYPTSKYTDNLQSSSLQELIPLQEMGFENEQLYDFAERTANEEIIAKYSLQRDIPAINGTSRLSVHLRFGTISIRQLAQKAVALNETEIEWIEAWNEFVVLMREKLGDKSLPGFPIWADDWVLEKDLKIPRGTPDWKENFLRKNSEFYTKHKVVLNKWLKKWNHLEHFPPSRRMFEWQAQDTKTLWEAIMHFRPSGIRAKKATYVPALVAITQTSIIGKQKRRITVREGARLQGLPDWFDFVDQADKLTYKQLGNGVNVGAVYNVVKAQVIRDLDLLGDMPALTRSILGAPANPDFVLSDHQTFHSYKPSTEPVDLTEFQQLRLIK